MDAHSGLGDEPGWEYRLLLDAESEEENEFRQQEAEAEAVVASQMQNLTRPLQG